jgi:hypothetical protein
MAKLTELIRVALPPVVWIAVIVGDAALMSRIFTAIELLAW